MSQSQDSQADQAKPNNTNGTNGADSTSTPDPNKQDAHHLPSAAATQAEMAQVCSDNSSLFVVNKICRGPGDETASNPNEPRDRQRAAADLHAKFTNSASAMQNMQTGGHIAILAQPSRRVRDLVSQAPQS
ncbi:hypothetical protein NPX13_g7894 [Xylaria arbuscula]|uniref:Uncharacterized protein n=1 Tax=Xylaria arbuscula TaxID=114810 RepID=A0A9W8TJY8_9PEZI|nr:hypothetical protein NPX13_g7894 [Xylaria arbuscula]